MKSRPVTRMGWHTHYARLYNKTGRNSAQHLACWFLLLHLAFDK